MEIIQKILGSVFEKVKTCLEEKCIVILPLFPTVKCIVQRELLSGEVIEIKWNAFLGGRDLALFRIQSKKEKAFPSLIFIH